METPANRTTSDPQALLTALGMDGLPEGFFDDKTGRSYRFHIFEDVVQACERSVVYTDDQLTRIQAFYERESDVALYAHVPWCVEECTYCYYHGKLERRPEMQRLLAAERAHAELMDELIGLRERRVPSLYFGGGTPTVLPADLLEEQLAFFTGYSLTDDAEVCVEASVGTLTPKKLDVLERYANRLSIGIQTFEPRLLQQVARTFSRERALEVLAEATRRFPLVNIDLLYGLRTQTIAELLESVERAIDLGITSVTLYRLEIRDDPPLVREYLAAPSAFPSELECRVMRAEAEALLKAAGYRENLVGWFLKSATADTKVYRERWEKQTPCIAFGPHVQNYGRGHFYVNVAGNDEYIARVGEKRLPIATLHELGPLAQLHISVMAQWKSNRVIDLGSLRARFGADLVDAFATEIDKFRGWGLLRDEPGAEREATRVGLTAAGSSLLEWLLDDLIAGLKRSRTGKPRVALPVV